MPSGEQNS